MTTTRSIIGSLCGCFACGNVSPLGCHLRYSLCALVVTSCRRQQLPPSVEYTLVAVFNLFGIYTAVPHASTFVRVGFVDVEHLCSSVTQSKTVHWHTTCATHKMLDLKIPDVLLNNCCFPAHRTSYVLATCIEP